MRLGPEARQHADRPIRDFMTAAPQSLREGDKIAYALHSMDLGGYRHLPITSEGRVTGVISVRDILRYITDRLIPADNAT